MTEEHPASPVEDDPASTATTAGSDDGEQGGPGALLASLGVKRHAKLGIVVATVAAAVVYSPWVLRLWADGTDELVPAVNFLSLTFVLWFSIAFSVAVWLTGRAALRPIVDHEAWLKRGGVAAVLGGVGWLSLPAHALLVDAGYTGSGLWQFTAIASGLLLLVGAAGLHASVKTGAGRLEAGGYLLVLVGLGVGVANATGSPAPTTVIDGTTIPSPYLLGTTLALMGTVALAAGAELTGRLPTRPLQGLLGASVVGVLGVAALFALDGIGLVPASVTDAAALALIVAPAGLAWIVVGRSYADHADDALTAAHVAGVGLAQTAPPNADPAHLDRSDEETDPAWNDGTETAVTNPADGENTSRTTTDDPPN